MKTNTPHTTKKDTPLMVQYKSIKAKYPDALLLFRMGDFYETFGQDAIIAAGVLGIALTKRNSGAAEKEELAGFPHHAIDNYLPKLVKAGYRVAICEQLEDPKQTKTIVKRGVTEIVTPGVTVNDRLLDHKQNNYLASLYIQGTQQGIAFLDISTGEFLVAEGSADYIDQLIQSFAPAEIIYAKPYHDWMKTKFQQSTSLYALEEWVFQKDVAYDLLIQHFGTNSLKGFGIEDLADAIAAAGAILHYLQITEHPERSHISKISKLQREDAMWLDKFTIRNLELLQCNHLGGKSFIDAIDNTLSPMGARMLRKWVLFPLIDVHQILERQKIVQEFIDDHDVQQGLAEQMKYIADLERLISKAPMNKINPRDLLQLKRSLIAIEEIKALIGKSECYNLQRLVSKLDSCKALITRIETEISEDAPALAQKGGVFKSGVIDELDELRNISMHGKEILLQIEAKEKQNTGIPSLKIGFNNVFGYYLEVTSTHKNKVPPEWTRKQTLANAERFITSEIKEFEEKILGAEEKILQLELLYFQKLVTEVNEYLLPIQNNAQLIAKIDVLWSFSTTAQKHQYHASSFHEGSHIRITDGRHPVIEQQLPLGESYIPNSIELNQEDQQIIIITGPNMSGKSAILRQTALIILLAQMGSFVPAKSAELSIIDRLFTRVGASDNISSGESTFMVEMIETASILNNITTNSLILLDEIGRGTSTYDGISIAWSIGEYLHNAIQQPKTLFATHYHELNELEQKFERIKNYHVATAEHDQKVIFLRKLKKGGSMHSFGIHVAKMAGMPAALIDRANLVLEQLEAKGKSLENKDVLKNIKTQNIQLSIFEQNNPALQEIIQKLNILDINTITPVESLMILQQLKSWSDKL